MNYLIYGTSYRLIDDEIKKIIQGKEHRTIYLNETPIEEIIDDVCYESMFDEQKNLIIKNFEELFQSKKEESESLNSLLDYLKKPNKNAILIFISNEKLGNKGKQAKEIIALLNVIETPILTKPYELSKIFGSKISQDGYGISQNALNMFSEKCFSDYDIAYMEFEKLKKIKQGNKLITEKDVEELVSNYNTNDLFAFKDAIINKNIKKALNMIEELENSKIEIVPLVVMIAKEYQVLYNVQILSAKKISNDEIGEKLGKMHPYRVKMLKESSQKYRPGEIEKIILYLCNLDLKLVSEDNLGFDELRKFLLEL